MSEIELHELVRRLGEVPVLDVRTEPEFAGTGGHHCDPRQGHIPGARNLDLQRLLTMTADQIRSEVGLPEGAELVAYCHSGGRSAVAVEVLRSAGYEARNYAGSWHEWSRHEELPEH